MNGYRTSLYLLFFTLVGVYGHAQQPKPLTYVVSQFEIQQHQKMRGIKGKGMSLTYELEVKYATYDSGWRDFRQYWEVWSTSGEKLFDSRDLTGQFYYQLPTGNPIINKSRTKFEFFVRYEDFPIKEGGVYEIRLQIEEKKSKSIKMHGWEGFLPIPDIYVFEDQRFTAFNRESRMGMRDGVQGLEVKLTAETKFSGPRLDPDKGNYFVNIEINNNVGKAILHHYEVQLPLARTTQMQQIIDCSEPETDRFDLHFFVPLRHLNISPGLRDAYYRVYVTDASQQIRFPDLATGTIRFEMPEVKSAEIYLRKLEVQPLEYDTEVAGIGNAAPDLQWKLKVGEDVEFLSEIAKNDYTIIPGRHTIQFVEGDIVSIELDDQDKGLFSKADRISQWQIPYDQRGEVFQLEISNQPTVKEMVLDYKIVETVFSPFKGGF